MHRTSVRGFRVVVGGWAALAVVASGLTPVQAAEPTLLLFSEARAFSPDGDGYEDQLQVAFSLADSANVTATVVDQAGAEVDVLARGQSTPAGDRTLIWDGFDAAGQRTPAGSYRVLLSASNASGSSSAELATAVDLRTAAVVEAPAPGAQLSGVVDVRVAPASDLVLTQARPRLSTGCTGEPAAPGADGKVLAQLDTANCGAGEVTLFVDVSWTDALGAGHTRPLELPVTVVDELSPSVDIFFSSDIVTRSSAQAVAPANGVVHCSDNGGVTSVVIEVVDTAGALVQTLRDVQGGCPNPGWDWAWEGPDASSPTPPAPVEHVLRVRATDTDSRVTERTWPLYADLRVPGRISEPSASPTVTMTTQSPVAVAAGDGVSPTAVQALLGVCSWALAPGPDGFRSVVDATVCGAVGDQELRAQLTWTTAFGQARTYEDVVRVSVPDTQAPLVSVDYTAPLSLTSPTTEQEAYVQGYCSDNSGALDLSLAILDSAGQVRRTLVPTCVVQQWYFTQYWDGRDDAGQPVPDGDYRAVVTGTDAAGHAASGEHTVTVDRRVPGAHVAPETGSSLSGVVPLSATATVGISLRRVVFSLPGCGAEALQADADGRWTASLDTAPCAAGEQELSTRFEWSDDAGRDYSYTSSTPVTLVDLQAPQLTGSGTRKLIALADAAQTETHGDLVYCSDNTGVTALELTILDEAGDALRTEALPHESCAWPGYHYFSWDLKDSAGTAVPDGSYASVVRAVDAAGNASSVTNDVVVRRVAPGVLSDPQPGAVLAGAAPVVFLPDTRTATIGQVSLDLVTQTYGIVNASQDGRWRTTIPVGDLPAGAATLGWRVSWTDAFGGAHLFTGDDRPVTIEPDAVPLAASLDVSRGPAPLDVSLTIETSDGRSRPVQLDIDWGDGSPIERVEAASPYAPVVRSHRYPEPGARTIVVTASNGAGGHASTSVPVVAEGAPNQAPTLTTAVSPLQGAAPHDVTVGLTAADPDGDALTYKVDFGDGSAPLTGVLPHEVLGHTYTRSGSYFVRSSVSDGALTAARTSLVTVVLPEPLTAQAGDDQQVIVGDEVVLDGGGSRPGDLVDRWEWQLGDGATATGPRVTHAYAEPGAYTTRLTITSGTATSSDTATVTVLPPPRTPGLDVLLTSGGAPLSGGQALVVRPDGTKVSATTDAAGHALLQGLPDGATTVYAIAPGHQPKAAQAALTDGSGELVVELLSGEIGAATLEATRLTAEQAAARGVDPTDESNFHVYEAKIHLVFVDEGQPFQYTPQVTVSRRGVRCVQTCDEVIGTPTAVGCFALDADGYCRGFRGGGYSFYPSVSYVEKEPVVNWLVIPVRARFAKELFDVQMIVQNLTAGFDFDPGVAELTLPPGLSLAALTRPQSLRVDVPAVPGGQSRTVNWVVRGDQEGSYQLSAAYTSLVMPFEQPVRLEAVTADPLRIWAGSALRLEVEAEDKVSALHPYRVRVGLHNLADVPVYNASVEYLTEGRVNYIYQPREQLLAETAVIQPGETFWNDAILVPQIFGTLDLTRSFVKKTGGTVDLQSRIVSVPRHRPFGEDPTVEAFPMKDGVGLVWEKVPGATSYEIFATTDLDADFPAEPAVTVSGTSDRAVASLPGGSSAWYAIRTVTAEGAAMEHPATIGMSSTTATQPRAAVELSAFNSCNRDIGASIQLTSVFHTLTAYRITLGTSTVDREVTPTVDSGGDSTASLQHTIPLSQLGSEQQTLLVSARDTSGEWGPAWQATVSSACPDYRVAVVGDSIAWGQGLQPEHKYPWLIADEIELRTGRRAVEPIMLAHSGAVLEGATEGCPAKYGEVPSGSPEIIACQIERDLAATQADLVLLDGCINDVGVVTILLAVGVEAKTRDKCGTFLPRALDAVHATLPDAKVVLTGYYPIVSPLSVVALTSLAGFVGPQAAGGAALTTSTMAYGSAEFDSTFRSIAQQVVNPPADATGTDRSAWASFADPGFSAADAMGVPVTSKLWHGLDDAQVERRSACWREARTNAKCYVASIGHPDRAGAVKYRDAIVSARNYRDWTSKSDAAYEQTDGAAAPVASGDTVGTGSSAEADAATGQPHLAITTPVAGAISIARQPSSGSATGYALLGQEFGVQAPEASADSPLRFVFRADEADLGGADPQSVAVSRNGTVVPDCSGSTGQAAPDPCVLSRTTSGTDVVLTVLTSRASTWQLLLPVVAPSPTAGPVDGGTGSGTGGSDGGGTGGGAAPAPDATSGPTPTTSPTPAPTASPTAAPTSGSTPGGTAGPGSAAPSPGAEPSRGPGAVTTSGRYSPLVPARIYDSRQTGGIVRAGADRAVQVLGRGGVPTGGVSAVVVNLTSAGTTGVTDVQVYPTGGRPAVRTSNLNPRPGGAVATLVTTAVGRDGTISLSTAAGAAHLVLDVVGWYGDSAGAGFHPLVPARIADTRTDRRPVVASADTEVTVTGVGGVPASGVEAVVVNLTATGATASTDLQLYPVGAKPRVRTSNLNLGRNQTRANLAVVKVGADGRIGVSTAGGQTHVVLDVVGWYGDGGLRFVPATPVRAFDSRDARQPVVAGADREVVLAGRQGVPADARAVVGSVTVVGASRPADLQLFPTGQRPEQRTSNVNVPDGLPVPNLAVLGLGARGASTLSLSSGAAHVVVDVAGWFEE